METVVIVSIGIIGLVAVTYMVTQKNVRKHITEISFGKIIIQNIQKNSCLCLMVIWQLI